MFQIFSTLPFEPLSAPGVKIHLRGASVNRRARLEERLLPSRKKLITLARGMKEIEKQNLPADIEALEIMHFSNQADVITNAELKPAYLELFVAGIEGMTVNGEPATTADLLENADPMIADEIYYEIERRLSLTEDEAKNSQPLTTSGASEGGRIPTTTAPNASGSDFINIATAEHSSPAK